MYPATTSLVNVVPKLSSTGRDLLQVKDFHYGNNELMISCFRFIFLFVLCRIFWSAIQYSEFQQRKPYSTLTLPISAHPKCQISLTSFRNTDGPVLPRETSSTPPAFSSLSVWVRITSAIAGQRDPETLLPLHVYDLIIMIWLWPWLCLMQSVVLLSCINHVFN